MNVFAENAETAAGRLREFLLHGPAQQQASVHAGAVAGTIGADGSVQYVYGEITGYYLHWLASLDTRRSEVRSHALAATQWLERYLQGDLPPATRIYLGAAADDWRNQALFAFDLAMIAGGLSRATAHGLIAVPENLSARLLYWLQRFVVDGQLGACIASNASVELPSRWSTKGGSFTAKTASRILLLARQTPVDTALRAACEKTLSTYALAAEQNGIDMLHPTLYAIEGCLLSPQADAERLALWFEQIVALQAADGSLPEALQSADIRRTDIIAQALRVAVFLQDLLGQPARYQQACKGFAEALCARVRPDGSIGFIPTNPEANIWCAMFAEQALRLYAASLQDKPLPFTAEDLA